MLLIDEAGAAEARRRPAGDGHAGRAPGSIVSMGRPGPNGGESNLAPRPPLLQILANWTRSVRDHHAPNNTGAFDDVQILMSALNYVLDDRQVMVVTDSLASYLDRRPRSFQTKVFPLPHVNGVICGTSDTTVPHVPADERDIMAALLRQLRQRRTTRVLERGNAER